MDKKESSGWFTQLFLTGRRPYLWISFAGFLVYFWVIFFGFSYLDDSVLILDNIYFLKNLGNLNQIFTTEVFHVLHASASYYRPILTFSFMLDAQFGGVKPYFYHFTNLVIHLLTASCVYLFLFKLKIKKDLAFVFALVFAVHPLLSQAVAWIPGRNDSLLTLFFLLTFIFFLNYLKTQRKKDLLFHFLFFFLAIFTKESAIFIPPVIILYLWIIEKKKLFPFILSFLYVWSGIGILWFVLRSIALSANPTPYTMNFVVKSLYLNFPAVFLYLGKVLLPFNLSVLPTLEDATLIYGFLTLLLIVLAFVFAKKPKNEFIIFGFILFIVFLLSSFIRPNTDYVADFLEHRMYLPIIGIFIILSEIGFLKNLDFAEKKTFFAFIILLGVLIVINFLHTNHFRNQMLFWQNAVASSPHHPLAHKNLGAMYYFNGNLDQAEKEYLKALQLNSGETMVHNNLGLIYLNRNDFQKAEAEFMAELNINPGYDNAYVNLGILYYKNNQGDKAEEAWLRALVINPDHLDARKALALYYYQKGLLDKANYQVNELLKRGVKL